MKRLQQKLARLSKVAGLFVCLAQPVWPIQPIDAGKAAAENSPPTTLWLDADGEPLPFQTDDQILRYLQEARIVSSKTVGVGINGIQKVVLEKGGLQVHAAFRDVRERKRNVRLQDGRFHLIFSDDCIFEVAAYRLSRILGINAVPPTVERTIQRRKGTLQIWVEKAMMQSEYLQQRPKVNSARERIRQHQMLYLFDSLISNDDRNAGNLLWDPDGKLWMIDHTRAFRWDRGAPGLERIRMCDRAVFQRLKEVGDDVIESELKGVLSRRELSSLLERRQQIVEHLERLIAEKGEEDVLFER
jgi:hypothetical protein